MRDVRVIVVGQGLAGSLLSYQLCKHSVSHVVVAPETNRMASVVAAGMYNPLVFKRITKSWRADYLLPVMKNTFLEIEQLLEKKLLHHKPIAKLINPSEKEWWNERIASQQLEGYIQEFKKKAQLPGVLPQYESVIIDKSGYIDLATFILAYREFLDKHKLFFAEKLDYSELELIENGAQWKGIKSQKVVFCEGAYSVDNPWFSFVPFYPTNGDVLEVEIEGVAESFIINKDVFILPVGNGRFKVGATYNHANLSWQPNLQAAEYLINKASILVRKPIRIINHVAGIRPTIKDRRPVLGLHPKYKQLAIFNGLGTKGVMLGPHFSIEMYKLLMNAQYDLNAEVSLDRFSLII
jgi:glycine/D-amino acid oxidase-like deaminating enzyme